MTDRQIDNKRYLMDVEIFNDLTEEQIAEIATWFLEVKLEPWQPLFSERDPEEDFYIIQSGRIFVYVGKEEEDRRVLSAGEYFTETDLLFGHPDTAYITSDQPTQLLMIEARQFHNMVGKYPQIKPWLARNPESQWLVSSRNFEWVGEDEVVYYVARKHIAMFVFGLTGPIILSLLAIGIVFAVSSANGSTIWTSGVVCSFVLVLAAVIWGIWDWVDWGNDYYIVTDQRVVWLEKVIFLYESRDEAPLTTILAVNTTSTFLGRIFNYGSVVVRTFTGEITFRNLKDPKRMAAIIEEYRARLVKGSERREKREINKLLRQRLGLEDEDDRPAEGTSEGESDEKESIPSEEVGQQKRSAVLDYLGTFFMMRFEEDDVITYRKYWPTLFGKIWIPTVLILAAMLSMVILVSLYISGVVSAQFTQLALAVALAMIVIVFVPWWIYRYVDWRNDIYQVTDRNIIDIERTPLGTEVKKSAPVENILSLEHERVGFLGYMLNYGFVTINVGETQFIFRNVHDPARVQQDIFNRIYALQRHKEQVEAAQRRQRFVDVIGVYHESFEEDEDDYFDDYYDDFGVELGSDDYP
jgi:hypothetical protein